MFHASGWTFPWSITFAAAAQVSALLYNNVVSPRVTSLTLRSA